MNGLSVRFYFWAGAEAGMKHALLLGIGVAMFAGCQHAPPPARMEGSSTITFVEPPSVSSKYQAAIAEGPRQPVEALLVAVPIEPLAKPVYPAAALGREKIPVVVGVRITV